MKARSKKTKPRFAKNWVLGGGLVGLLVVALGAWWLVSLKPAATTVAPQTSATPLPSQGPAKVGNAPAGPEAPGAVPSVAPSLAPDPNHPVSSTLAAPTFINSRQNVPMNVNVESTCQSVAGATCYVQATQGSIVKQLTSPQTVTANGGTYSVIMDWNSNKLSPGTWSITAVATLNGQTATSSPSPLTVTN